jgi:alanine racemase
MLTQRVVPGECAAVVKGDAYGCGIEQVTAALTSRRLQDILCCPSDRGAPRARHRS